MKEVLKTILKILWTIAKIITLLAPLYIGAKKIIIEEVNNTIGTT